MNKNETTLDILYNQKLKYFNHKIHIVLPKLITKIEELEKEKNENESKTQQCRNMIKNTVAALVRLRSCQLPGMKNHFSSPDEEIMQRMSECMFCEISI
jgi:dihydroxyacetone kinase